MDEQAAMEMMQQTMMFMGIFWLLVMVLMIVSYWKLFTMAGRPGWAAIVPIYNIIVWLNIAGKPWWWLLLLLIPLVNFVIAIMATSAFLKAYGKNGVGSVILAIFFPFIYFPIMAFGGDTSYKG